MTLNQLRVFWTVAAIGNVNDAALALGLNSASVLMHIRALEKNLGSELYERGHRGNVVLTQAGIILRDHAAAVIRETDEARQEILNLTDHISNTSLRLGANTTGGMYVLPDIVRTFMRLKPEVQVLPIFDLSPKLMEHLLQGLLDVVLTGGPIPNEGFESTIVGPDELVLIASPEHPLGLQGHASLNELGSETLILAGMGSRSRWLIETKLHQAGLPIRNAITLNGTEDVKRAVMANLGIGFVSMYSILAEIAVGSLNQVAIPTFRMRRNLALYWSKDGSLFPDRGLLEDVARETVTILKEAAAKLLPNTV